jgi:uncharacterized protein YijF (DUF1287 family)
MKKKTLRNALILCALALIIAAALFFLPFHGTSDRRKPDLYTGETVKYVSDHDEDGDGVDDQTDLLNSALEYLGTHPRYKSIYYAGGYPDDNHGVCTDVIAFGLLGAGYDLSALVDEDRRQNPDLYADEAIDSNIDFRRVRNLIVYFEGNAEKLTDDLNDIDEWQGGDIVIFKNHIGMVSDRRNRKGIPYLIHHYSPFQRYYEEDVLEKRTDLIGHYRFPG